MRLHITLSFFCTARSLVCLAIGLVVCGDASAQSYHPVWDNGSSMCPPTQAPQWCPPQLIPTPRGYAPNANSPYRPNYSTPPTQNRFYPSQPMPPNAGTPSTGAPYNGGNGQTAPSPQQLPQAQQGQTAPQPQSPAAAAAGSPSAIQNALAQTQGNSGANVFQAAMQNGSGASGGGYDPAGYARDSQRPPNSIGDFFGGRLNSRSALLRISGEEFLFFPRTSPITNPLLTQEQVDYFRGVDRGLGGPTLTNRLLLSGANGVIFADPISLRTIPGTVPPGINIHQAGGLVSTGDSGTGLFDGLQSSVPALIVDDTGPFVVRTIDFLPGAHTDILGNAAQVVTFSEDINGNGILDPGEDINASWTLDTEVPGTEAEVFGLFRNLVIPNPGDLVGRLKVAENNNPVPRDRFIFDYTFFENVGLHANGNDVQRFVPGFEKTLFGDTVSVDVRVPFATTLDSTVFTSDVLTTTLPGLTNTNSLELGDMSIAGKILLGRNDYWAVSAGAQVTLPTAEDVRVHLDDSVQTELLRIENKAIHVMPFLAMMNTPNDRLFMQYYLQYDTTRRGNPVSYRGDSVGKFKDPDFIYADASMGYWVYSKPPQVRTTRQGRIMNTRTLGSRGLTGFAPRAELHYNRSIGSVKQSSQGADLQLLGSADDLESLNLTLGATMLFGADRELTVAWGAPILNRSDRDFDNELRVSFNWLIPQ